MTEAEIIALIKKIKRAKRGEYEAPHKPMLLLLALRLHSDGVIDIPFDRVDSELGLLLKEFGGNVQTSHYPFWHLQFDCEGRLWELRSGDGKKMDRDASRRPQKGNLRAQNATARLGQAVLNALSADPFLNARLANAILHFHFPESLHERIREALKMKFDKQDPIEIRKDERASCSEFRREVLLAYNFQCAICNFTVMMNHTFIALEAVHIRWRNWDGPNIVTNGIALCANHHRMFDLGIFTLEGPEKKYAVRISKEAQFPSSNIDNARRLIEEMRFSPPLHQSSNPDPKFLKWHRDHIFDRQSST